MDTPGPEAPPSWPGPRALPVVASAVRGAVVFFRAAPLFAANHALPGARVARDAVAIQRNLAELNRPAVSIAPHANRVATLVAACASVVRGTGIPQLRLAAAPRRPRRVACSLRPTPDAHRAQTPPFPST